MERLTDLKNDFKFYAENCLKIRPKDGKVIPFKLNKAQRHLHSIIEEQKKKTGKVRILILKARQLGSSTYVAGRYYWLTSMRFGVKTFILTHRKDATANLYNMVRRLHENVPSVIRPSTGVSNSQELKFSKLDSGYGIGTAGSGDIGRSDTIQYFHGSEVAFWDNTDEIFTGIMQTIPDLEGTEIILESTANGMGNAFHSMCLDAISGQNEYKVVFLPWFWDESYQLPVKDDFRLTDEEMEYKRLYTLTDEQVNWRRNKISILGNDWKFKQEYPSNEQEAFQTSGDLHVIDADHVQKCLKFKSYNFGRFAPIIGVDVARSGEDESVVTIRQGDKILGQKVFTSLNPDNPGLDLAQKVIDLYIQFKAKHILVDGGGVGASPVDFLKHFGYNPIEVLSGKQADDPVEFANKRAEMWFRMAEAIREGLELPNDPKLILQLCSQPFSYRANDQKLLMSKDKMKELKLKSPDRGDSIALTYAYNLNTLIDNNTRRASIKRNSGNINDLRSLKQ